MIKICGTCKHYSIISEPDICKQCARQHRSNMSSHVEETYKINRRLGRAIGVSCKELNEEHQVDYYILLSREEYREANRPLWEGINIGESKEGQDTVLS